MYSGGKFTGWLETKSSSSFTIAGGDFRLNGAPISALATPGTEQQIDLPEFGVLSGTLSDGTPFAFSSSNQWFASGTLTLKAAGIPVVGPSVIRVPSDPVPQGLRSGQTLLLSDGGDLGDHFTADWGSIVRMSGGRIGRRFQAVGSFVNITGGEIGSINALFGSVVNIDGGIVKHHLIADRGAIANVSAGEIAGTVYAKNGGRVNITGGTVRGYFYAYGGSSLDIRGGIVEGDISLSEGSTLTLQGGETHGKIRAWQGSRLNIRGGRLADGLFVAEGGVAMLNGTDFRIDGELIDQDSLNAVMAKELPSSAVLSGVLLDGTPFAFTSSEGDHFSPGTLQVSSSRYRLLPRNIKLPLFEYASPKGLRPGGELTLETGQNVGTNFTAGWESQLIVNGGEIGNNFEAVGAQVSLLDGAIGEDMDVLFGSEFSVAGGAIGRGLEAHRGSIVNLFGGTIPEITARQGSLVNITGGILGRYLDGEYDAGIIRLEAGSELQVTGTDFLLDGSPVEGLEEGNSIVLEWDERPFRYLSLSAQLLDGSTFVAYIGNDPRSHVNDWQYGGSPTITLTKALAHAVVPEPSSFALFLAAVLSCARRRTIHVSRTALRHEANA